MGQRYLIGVDISKHKVDCALMDEQLEVYSEREVVNREDKLKSYLKWVLKQQKTDADSILVCCETTGIYSSPLKRACEGMGISLWVEHALKIKRASTDMRGKSDRQDALRIAEYACRYQDKAILYKPLSESVKGLKDQQKIRETLLGQKVMLENQLREAKSHDKELYKTLESGYGGVLKKLRSEIKKTEERIETLSRDEESIRANLELLRSIPGVGLQIALQFIIRTDNFKSFKSAKHLACYAGVVPFANESGKMVKKARTSKMANQSLKQLLHLGAMAAIRVEGEIREYYKRKVAEGKNKMSVLNAVRNKLVHRIFAVIQRQTPYLLAN